MVVPREIRDPWGVYDSFLAAYNSGAANPFYLDEIDDRANLGLNWWITVEDKST